MAFEYQTLIESKIHNTKTDTTYLVVTLPRDSSTWPVVVYYGTFVWTLTEGVRDKFLEHTGDSSDTKTALRYHAELCQKYFYIGEK